ncbi:MAG: hypothetical protein IIC02_07010, partial [Planctomycetes bacterium]|nr:hypothetical protein [Planctomycetota bacterium]
MTDRYQLSQSLPSASLRVVPVQGRAPFTFRWSVENPAGEQADDRLDSVDGSVARFTAGALTGPYSVYCVVTDSCGREHTAGLVLQVGGDVGLGITTPRLGVLAGGGLLGQVTVRLNPRSGQPPFSARWVCLGPDGRIDNERLDSTEILSPRFTSDDRVGTYVLTAMVVNA